jgi:hydrogenase maturation protease
MNPRILVAGIGNIFLGDDGFGVEVVRRLAERVLPKGVQVVDFGIRGMDLVYALLEEHDTVLFVDAAPCGGRPGDLYVIEPQIQENGQVTLDAHGMNPVKVLALARAMGAPPVRTVVIGCEPETSLPAMDGDEVRVGLSAPVRTAVEEAVHLVMELVETLCAEHAEIPKGSFKPFRTEGECFRARVVSGDNQER